MPAPKEAVREMVKETSLKETSVKESSIREVVDEKYFMASKISKELRDDGEVT
jgi:hypothetical protein